MNAIAELFLGFIVLVIVSVIYFLGTEVGSIDATRKIHTEAVELGHAHWVTKSNGSSTFKWNKK